MTFFVRYTRIAYAIHSIIIIYSFIRSFRYLVVCYIQTSSNMEHWNITWFWNFGFRFFGFVWPAIKMNGFALVANSCFLFSTRIFHFFFQSFFSLSLCTFCKVQTMFNNDGLPKLNSIERLLSIRWKHVQFYVWKLAKCFHFHSGYKIWIIEIHFN